MNNKKGQLAIIAVVAIVLIVAGFYFFGSLGNSSAKVVSGDGVNSAGNSGNTRVINVDAEKFQYSPDVIKVKKGERVKIVINNVDFNHGMVIPGLGLSGIDSIEFTADKAGTFEFRCPTPCGSDHRDMIGTLVIEE